LATSAGNGNGFDDALVPRLLHGWRSRLTASARCVGGILTYMQNLDPDNELDNKSEL
jgi:hypothetical protein